MIGAFDISVIIPALHEKDRIEEAIESIRTAKDGYLPEIIVVDGSHNLDTVSSLGRSDIVKMGTFTGRSIQMNAGAKAAKGSILLFLHADTILPEDGLMEISEAFKDSSIAGGAFDLRFKPTYPYLRFLEFLNRPRIRITRIPYGDHGIFIRKEVFDRLGGYWEHEIMEDMDLMRRLRKYNLKIRIVPDPVYTSSRRFADDGFFLHTLRYALFAASFWLGIHSEKMSRSYHKSKR